MPISIEVEIPLTPTSTKRTGGNAGAEGQWGLVEDSQTGNPKVRDNAPSGNLGTLLTALQSIDPRVSFTVASVHTRIAHILFPGLNTLDEATKGNILSALRNVQLKVKKAIRVPSPPSGILPDNGQATPKEGPAEKPDTTSGE